MVEEIMYFLAPLVAFALLALGFQIRDSTTVIVGGILLFIYGVIVLINPLPTIASLMNDVIGHTSWAFGLYVWVRSTIEVYGSKIKILAGG